MDGVCVLQLLAKQPTKDKRYHVENISNLKIKIRKVKPNYVINIINIYSPTSDRTKKLPNEI